MDTLPAAGGPGLFDPRRRALVIEQLHRRYGRGGRRARLRFLWKKHAWLAVTGGARGVKRGLDVAGAAAGLVVLSPLLAAVAAAVKACDGGPVLYWQTRVGRHGREFAFPKFRSMVAGADGMKGSLAGSSDRRDGVTFKMRRDPRTTPVGRVLRKLSLDELPQLWCVLAGDMSLVGPRPPLPEEVRRYTLSDRRRLDVKPGLTCFWQVEGRGDAPFGRQVVLDIEYIESMSLWLDLKLLGKTVPAVLSGRGAY
jgi:lipopolysaccharide/colanic/teichoic acid biosynthesis glycosyltransferase